MVIRELKKIRDFLMKARNKIYFYEDYRCSFSIFWLIYANLYKPSRTLRRLKNNASKRFNLFAKRTDSKIDTNVKFDHTNPDSSFFRINMALRTHGAVVIEDYFNKTVIDNFSKFYENEIYEIKSKDSGFGGPLALSKELLDVWLNSDIYKFISNYYGTVPYCRSYPMLQYIDKNSTKKFDKTKKGIAYPWHIDHCSILVQAIYLSNIDADGTHMEIVSGSHNYPNVCLGLYSDEYIENSGLTIKKLYGPLGSIQIHDPNVVHRAYPVNDSDRLWLYSDFSWGENILLNLDSIVGMLSGSTIPLNGLNGFNQENSLDLNSNKEGILPFQLNALSGIFPNLPPKGYQMKNGYLTPNVSKEI